MRRVLTDEGVPAEKREQFRDSLEQIIGEASRAGRIVGDLLTFSRGYRAQRTPTDLNEVVRQSVAGLGPLLLDHAVEARLDLAGSLPLVPLDAARVRQVVTNLVRNAAEAKPRSRSVRVITRLDEAAGAAVLAVEDDGEGIAPENLKRIFEPFFTTKEGCQGIGLGLAVVYGIVEAHRGTVDVTSEPATGTVFTVRFPLAVNGDLTR
jgi:signal transduction histidine kinase